jgi:hypothetical protein
MKIFYTTVIVLLAIWSIGGMAYFLADAWFGEEVYRLDDSELPSFLPYGPLVWLLCAIVIGSIYLYAAISQ